MPKFTTLFMVAILASLVLTYAAARPEPSMVEAQHAGVVFANEEGCEGLNKDDCLLKMTLKAHVDYIYTQSSNVPHNHNP
ncbi:Phytosulfokine-beta like [Actinidia chinensis var. chinensis]|uniref:Phytosulfokine n=1 Tax=Actinidia chinensis var. chinensis TaxID=1590841 RepID=A0A2R6Q0I6_ACTCC|nr:Phytosulfokine-beta like [Actinidia chinensis var. chinensis]